MHVKRFRELDLLRAYAVALVVWLHLNLLNGSPSAFTLAVLTGTDMGVGVDLFFVISGYVISLALAQLWNLQDASQALEMRNVPFVFYQKRFVRLWPATAFWLIITLILATLFEGKRPWPPFFTMFGKVASGFVYLYNFQEAIAPSALGYLWSLSVEWQFYLVLPVLLLTVRSDIWRLIILLGSLLAFCWSGAGGEVWWLFRFQGLVVGITLFVLRTKLGIEVPIYRSLKRPLGRNLTTLLLIIAMAASPRFTADARLGSIFASVLGGVLVFFASADRQYIGSFGIKPIVAWIGSRSYSIYLVHIPVIMSVFTIGDTSPSSVLREIFVGGYYPLALIITGVCSELSYRYIEAPCHRASRQIPLYVRERESPGAEM